MLSLLIKCILTMICIFHIIITQNEVVLTERSYEAIIIHYTVQQFVDEAVMYGGMEMYCTWMNRLRERGRWIDGDVQIDERNDIKFKVIIVITKFIKKNGMICNILRETLVQKSTNNLRFYNDMQYFVTKMILSRFGEEIKSNCHIKFCRSL